MKEPKELPAIQYLNKMKLIVNVQSHKKDSTKKYMDEIITPAFLKNYFSLMHLSKSTT